MQCLVSDCVVSMGFLVQRFYTYFIVGNFFFEKQLYTIFTKKNNFQPYFSVVRVLA